MPDSNTPMETVLRDLHDLGVLDYTQADMKKIRDALWKFCHGENRRLLDDNLALTDELHELRAEKNKYYEAWRQLYNRHSDNIRALTRMAVTLLQTGFRGTGVDEGVDWLAQQNKDLTVAVAQLEEMLKDAEQRHRDQAAW